MSAKEPDDNKHFPFFELARELRDGVYNDLDKARCSYRLGKKLGLHSCDLLHGLLQTALLLVSKQFNQEYVEQMKCRRRSLPMEAWMFLSAPSFKPHKPLSIEPQLPVVGFAGYLSSVTHLNLTIAHLTIRDLESNSSNPAPPKLSQLLGLMPALRILHITFYYDGREPHDWMNIDVLRLLNGTFDRWTKDRSAQPPVIQADLQGTMGHIYMPSWEARTAYLELDRDDYEDLQDELTGESFAAVIAVARLPTDEKPEWL